MKERLCGHKSRLSSCWKQVFRCYLSSNWL